MFYRIGNKYIILLLYTFFVFCSSESEPKMATLSQTLATQSGREVSGPASTFALEAQELIHTVQAIIEVDCKWLDSN